MKLYLVRHATAVEQLGGNIRKDADRPLTDEGRKEAEHVATALRKAGVKGDAFVHSPLVRARQTAEIFAEVLAGKSKLQQCDALAPAGDISRLYAELAKITRADEIFLFGHMPDMAQLAGVLLGCEELEMPFKKAAVCRIDVYDMPVTSPGTLKWFITPKLAEAFK